MLVERFLRGYSSPDYELKSKMGIFAVLSLLSAALSLVIGCIDIAAGASVAIIAMELAAVPLILAPLAIAARGRYDLGVALYLGLVDLVFLATTLVLPTYNPETLYKYGFYLLVSQILGLVIARGRIAILVNLCVNWVSQILVFVAMGLAPANAALRGPSLTAFLETTMMLAITSYLSLRGARVFSAAIDMALREAERSRARAAGMEAAVAAARSSLDVSRELREASNSIKALVDERRRSMEELEALSSSFQALLDRLAGENRRLRATAASSEALIGSQKTAVSETSAAVKEVTAAISGAQATAQERRESVQDLLSASDVGAARRAEVARSLELLGTSMKGEMDFVGVIEDVSARTGLLAMNASIEAAHAGAAGKGFTVVAGEIRKLAEQSAAQTKGISAVVKANRDSLERTGRANAEAETGFATLVSEAREVALAMGELLDRLSGMSRGAGLIDGKVGDLVGISGRFSAAFQEIIAIAISAEASFEEILPFFRDLSSRVSADLDAMNAIGDEARRIAEAGRLNAEKTESLNAAMSALAPES